MGFTLEQLESTAVRFPDVADGSTGDGVEWPGYQPEEPLSIEDLTQEELEWNINENALAKECRPLPVEMRKKHFSVFFSRAAIVREVSGIVFDGTSLELALKWRTKFRVEKALCNTINAISDARFEELWDMAQMDFVLSERYQKRQWHIAKYNIFKFFWRHYIADLPSERDFPELKAPPLTPVTYAVSAQRQTDYKIWPAMCEEWVNRQNAYRFATNKPGKVPGLN